MVLESTAEVAQPTTVYTFNGQGPPEQGMGMDLHNSPPAAENPKEKTINFGGIKNQAIRERRRRDTIDEHGSAKTLGITVLICHVTVQESLSSQI